MIVLLLAVLPGTALAELRLLMFERPGCIYCAKWDRTIAPVYPKTTEGQAAPLTRLQISEPLPEGITLTRAHPVFTPTFVLLRDGVEQGRIEGYPGEDFFWGLLDQMLEAARQ
ncbi:hypothetical protein NUW50_18010 [Frigidibacter sp. SLM-1]|nr:hypothetical protein [Frigidibacter sp. ROC022]MCR8726207.1 hypothetical protein [Frigidibacter sp. ROC022]